MLNSRKLAVVNSRKLSYLHFTDLVFLIQNFHKNEFKIRRFIRL